MVPLGIERIIHAPETFDYSCTPSDEIAIDVVTLTTYLLRLLFFGSFKLF